MSIQRREDSRLRFLMDRDGLEKTISFCNGTIDAYTRALKAATDGISAYGRVYKNELLGSISVLKSFVRDNNDKS